MLKAKSQLPVSEKDFPMKAKLERDEENEKMHETFRNVVSRIYFELRCLRIDQVVIRMIDLDDPPKP